MSFYLLMDSRFETIVIVTFYVIIMVVMMKGVVALSRPRDLHRTRVTSSSTFFPTGNPFQESNSSNAPLDSKIKIGRIPGYGIPNPGNGYGKQRRGPSQQQEFVTSGKKPWWSYQIASASSFSGYLDKVHMKINSLCMQPEYGSPGGGGRGTGGGNGGQGGGGPGGQGGSGDPMKGFTYLFAFAVLVSGILAYARKSSTTSLLVSTGVAVLLLISASLMGHPTYKIGTLLSLGTCMALSGLMGVRAKNSGKLFPSGVVSMMAGVMSVGYIVTLL